MLDREVGRLALLRVALGERRHELVRCWALVEEQTDQRLLGRIAVHSVLDGGGGEPGADAALVQRHEPHRLELRARAHRRDAGHVAHKTSAALKSVANRGARGSRSSRAIASSSSRGGARARGGANRANGERA